VIFKQMERIEIYSSKKKTVFLLIGSTAFVALGIWLFLDADKLSRVAINPTFTRAIGMASIAFFGLGIFVGVKRLIKSELSLVIDSKGLNVNPKKHEIIEWKEIQGFKTIRIQSTEIVIIGVNNPGYWLEKEKNVFRKKLMQFNVNNYNSPFNISSAGLSISSNELIETLKKYFDKFKNEA